MTGLPADNFSIRWDGYLYIPAAGSYTFYETSDDGMRLYLNGAPTPVIDQWSYVSGAERTYTTTFATPTWVQIRMEHRELTGSASFDFKWSGPGFAKQAITPEYLNPTLIANYGNYGSDDNFNVLATSPTIDAGNPTSQFFREPMPNGGRVNLGATGNSASAVFSSAQAIQVLSPDAMDKLEQGQTVTVNLRSSGLLANQPTLLINGGTNAVGAWSGVGSLLTSGSSPNNVELQSATIDRSAVVDPIPEQLYRSYLEGPFGAGNALTLKLPVPDGTYSMRLHFLEPFAIGAGTRRFDIRANGVNLRTNYDVIATAGVRFKATAESYTNLVASQGNGLTIDLVNVTSTAAILSALELFTASGSTATTATAALDYSSDGGSSWQAIAGAGSVPIDRWGNAAFAWTIPSDQAIGNNYRLRARSTMAAGEVIGAMDESFLIANSGANYYVSPTGDNANSGKLAGQPMRSISGLVNAYDLDAGDIVNLAGGTYRTFRNIALRSQDSGVTLRAQSTVPVIIQRGNTSYSTAPVELAGADFVTLDGLRLTGGESGIFALDNTDSDDITIVNGQIYGNLSYGVWVGTTNDRWTLQNNKIFGVPGGATSDDQSYGVWFNSATTSRDHTLIGNEIFDHPQYAIYNAGQGTTIANNDLHGNRYGIFAQFSITSGAPLTIRDNEIHDNTEYGLSVNGNNTPAIVVTGNKVYGQSGVNDVGMYIYGSALASGNFVYGNYRGISTHSNDTTTLTRVTDNRVYNNSNAGITVDGKAQVDGNYVYSNSVGVYAQTSFSGVVANNVIYSNTNRGIWVQNFNNTLLAEYLNNTIYQPVGDGLRLDGSARNNRIVNNIIWVLSGYGIFVANDSQVGLQSDYNLFHQSADPNAYVGSWGGVNRDALTDWRTATTQDANSVEGSPAFVDIDGADNVLGYVASGNGINGGMDDNFYRTKNSPAIDRGLTWGVTRSDIEGFARTDDPPPTMRAAIVM